MGSATMPTTVATGILKPRRQGTPPICLGSTVIRRNLITTTSSNCGQNASSVPTARQVGTALLELFRYDSARISSSGPRRWPWATDRRRQLTPGRGVLLRARLLQYLGPRGDVTSPRCALRSKSISVRDCPMPLPMLYAKWDLVVHEGLVVREFQEIQQARDLQLLPKRLRVDADAHRTQFVTPPGGCGSSLVDCS